MSGHAKLPTPDAANRPAPEIAPNHRPVLAAAVTFVMAMAVTVGAASLVRGHLRHAAQAHFELRTQRITADLRDEFRACEQVMLGAGGLFAGVSPTGAVTRELWSRYVAQLDLADTLASARALGYADAPHPIPLGASGSLFAPVRLMWPNLTDAARPERDFGADATARAALLRATDSAQISLYVHAGGQPALQGNERATLDLYLPVYVGGSAPLSREARRAAISGFVVAVLDTEQLFGDIAMRDRRLALHVTVATMGTPPVPLYASKTPSDDAADAPPLFHETDTLTVGGEALTLSYSTSDAALRAIPDYSSNAVLAVGTLAAIFLAGIAFLLARRAAGTSAEASRANSQSTLNEARMMGIIRSSMEAIITVDEAQRIVIFNPMAERIFGCSAMDAIGAPLVRFIPERFRDAHERHVEQFGVTGVSERQMGQQRVLFGLRANGDEFPIEASISQILDANGKLYTVVLRDVTERVKADNALKASREDLRELSANLQNVREEEKARIARELHDDLGQQLTALKMDLSSVELALDALPAGGPEVRTQLRGMRRLIDATVASVRRIAADLRPVMLDDLGLVPAIEWLANDFTNRYGIDIERQIEPGDIVFTRNGATTLFRIVQEALTNVAKHADATRVTLVLRIEGEHCILRIADNGQGTVEADGRNGKSFGLLGIRERAHMLGGSIAIETAAARGFAITAVFPLPSIRQDETLP
jgi:PAS domain S-box-containing protein